jgi:hypothetical protein
VAFLNIYHAELQNEVQEGHLGLSPYSSSSLPNDNLLSKLYDQKAIGKKMFSLYLGNIYENQSSRIWFGGYKFDFFRDQQRFTSLSD